MKSFRSPVAALCLLLAISGSAAAQIVVIQGSDLITNSRATLNNNFSFLNTLLGSGLVRFTGPTVTRNFALPDVAATIITSQNLGTGFQMSGSTLTVDSTLATHDTAHLGENYLASTNGTAAYTASSPYKSIVGVNGCVGTACYVTGMTFLLYPDVTCTTSCSLNIDSAGLRNIKKLDGATDPGGTLIAAQPQWIFYNGTVFILLNH